MNLHYADPYLVEEEETEGMIITFSQVRCKTEGSYFTTDPDEVNCINCIATFVDPITELIPRKWVVKMNQLMEERLNS